MHRITPIESDPYVHRPYDERRASEQNKIESVEADYRKFRARNLKWEFRPSSRDGVPTTVEVLLIIPRETD